MSDETRLEWLRVDFIFSREGVMEEIGVILLNKHADSMEKVTTVKRVARVLLLLALLRLLLSLFLIPHVVKIPGVKKQKKYYYYLLPQVV